MSEIIKNGAVDVDALIQHTRNIATAQDTAERNAVLNENIDKLNGWIHSEFFVDSSDTSRYDDSIMRLCLRFLKPKSYYNSMDLMNMDDRNKAIYRYITTVTTKRTDNLSDEEMTTLCDLLLTVIDSPLVSYDKKYFVFYNTETGTSELMEIYKKEAYRMSKWYYRFYFVIADRIHPVIRFIQNLFKY